MKKIIGLFLLIAFLFGQPMSFSQEMRREAHHEQRMGGASKGQKGP